MDLANTVFDYLNKYPKQRYAINTQTLTIIMKNNKVDLEMDFGNQYSYFQEDIDKSFPEPIFDELDLNIFVDADHGHNKVKISSITGLLSVVGSTPPTWSSKRHT